MADVGRITELWRQAAAAADVPLTTEDLSLVTAMKLWRESEAECGRLREQLDAARQALAEELEQKAEAVIRTSALRGQLAALLHACTFVSSLPGDTGSPAEPSLEAWLAARAALGVEGEQE